MKRRKSGSEIKTCYGYIGRSNISRGRILKITLPDIKDDYRIILARDIPGINYIKTLGAGMPVLPEKNIDYKGQPLFIVGGPERETVKKIARSIQIDVEKEVPNFKYHKDQVCQTYQLKRGDYTGIEEKAFKIVEGEYRTDPLRDNSYEYSRMEIGYLDNSMTINTCTGDPFLLRDAVAEILDFSKNKIKVIARYSCDRNSGRISYPILVAGLAALLSASLKKNVRLLAFERDNPFYIPFYPESYIKYKTALDENGKILGINADISFNVGAFDLISSLLLEKAAMAACGGYQCHNAQVTAEAYRTNTLPLGYYAGLGELHTIFALEHHTSKICRLYQIDPSNWKSINLLKPNTSFFFGQKAKKTEDPSLVLEDVVKRSDFIRKYAAYEANVKRRTDIFDSQTPLKGIGLAFCFHGIGLPVHHETSISPCIKVVWSPEKKLEIFHSIKDKLSNIQLNKIASVLLNIPGSKVTFSEVDTGIVPNSGPHIGDRATTVSGKLLQQICHSLLKKEGKRKKKTATEVKRTYKPPKSSYWSKEELRGELYSAICWEATVVEVEVEAVSLIPEIKKVWISLDAGVLLNKLPVLIRVESGIICNYKLFFSDGLDHFPYLNIENIPETDIHFIEDPVNSGPLGIKGVGDLPVIGLVPALANAVSQVLAIDTNHLPIKPHLIFKSLTEEKQHEG
jgi:CO/xanthine dehydrogenase Mo-binding subunit